ncbi:sigma-54-dependent transcriptional regulator [Pseudodesulfovibrio tunisiensis]|uniref:sigma-54-dependent transcriptional regulator n=1 Tax=Pseudodesulfovibrio tunisiensis TaxID=463192 RepID=UPI001FB38802|nr:sigma-54 dependent transcriptional regulator [Pseudodesulfovibrio tunisiensis]
MAEILIIDGNAHFSEQLAADLSARGMVTDHCQSLARGMARLHTGEFRAVLLGDNLPDGSCLDFLSTIREIPSRPEVIILSSTGDPDTAETAIRNGAWNYVTKPVNIQRIMVLLQRVMEYHAERLSMHPMSLRRCGIVGSSRPMLQCLDEVALASATDSNVLIIGETGTGKELFARAIHSNSKRTKKPFVVVDCAALPDTLVESVLFGHEKGAFTSADARSVGLILQADGGTLFLDEIGELPMSIQKVFLRVLEGRSFRPVGGAREQTSDFRLLAATNRDLETMVDSGGFRQDLFYRLRGMRITLPPLRDILEDINELICHFIRTHSKRLRMPSKGFSPDFLDILMQYDWPGNIRELMHTIERAIFMSGTEPILYPRHLPRTVRAQVARRLLEKGRQVPAGCMPFDGDRLKFPDLKSYRRKQVAEIETRYLRSLLDVCSWDIKSACDISGLSRARLYALMKKRGIARA